MPAIPFGQLLVNNALPPQLRDYSRRLDGKGLDALLAEVATNHPDQYAEVAKKLSDIGREVDYLEGDTLGLDDNLPTTNRKPLFQIARRQAKAIESSGMDDKEKQEAYEGVFGELQKTLLDQVLAGGKASGNRYARQIVAKARGNPLQMAAITDTPCFYRDSRGRVIPVFIEHSYAEGLRPHEYWAATYGARSGIVQVKMGVRQGGDVSKQLMVAGGGQVVTQEDCGTLNGVPVKADDHDNLGAVLARAYGPYKAGTPISKDTLAYLRKKGPDEILVRSPICCTARTGVCSTCAGVREKGSLPEIGYSLGIVAGSALAEQIAQKSLAAKHTSGQKMKGSDQFTGFPVVHQLMQVPTEFPNKATSAELDGKVDRIRPAPQGGFYIDIDGREHYSESEPTVKAGDVVEAGDSIAKGLPNPADVVRHKGIGEGRRFFASQLTNVMRNSGWDVNRRNAEAVASSLINHVDVKDFDQVGDCLPGDKAEYGSVAWAYRPRPGAKGMAPSAARGKFLEQPALHYSIGTRVTRSVADQLRKHDINTVVAHDEPPSFEPEMVRLRAVPYGGKDWLAKLWSSDLMGNLLEDTARGRSTNLQGTHPVPRIIEGTRLDEGIYTPPKGMK